MGRRSRAAVTASPAFPSSRVTRENRARYLRSGLHTPELLGALCDRAGQTRPHATAVVDERTSLTFRQLEERVARLAGALAAKGVRAGDVLLWQCPNRVEVSVFCLAAWRIGGVVAPVVSLYREHELKEILEAVQPSAIMTIKGSHGFQHGDMFDALERDLGLELKLKMLVGGEQAGWATFEELAESTPLATPVGVAPDDPALILFTSGTTAGSKAVVHSSQSLIAATRKFTGVFGWSFRDTSHVPVPMSHSAGLMRGLLAPLYVSARAIVRERWRSAQVIDDIARVSATYAVAPGLLLDELIDAYEEAGAPALQIRFVNAGAPASARRRAEAHGIPVAKSYGMTELPGIALPDLSDPFDRRLRSAGRLAAGNEARITSPDADGVGELEVRGPDQMLGYLSPAHEQAVWTDDGYIRTGDLVRIDEEGYVSVTGRLKDVINRGGEKISALELELGIADQCGIQDAAVVPGTDPRLGEVPVAFVVASGWSPPPTAQELTCRLKDAGFASHKIPARFWFVDDLPKTASGKVKKSELIAADAARLHRQEV